jgi:peptidylglycine monooxygenase
MSDEQYTVILGDRRYAIHRKWARLPAGESFGFLSDLMVDAEGRVHVAQRGSEQPVLVFERDGRLAGSWGEGVLAEPHYINAASDGSILVADRDAHQVLRFDSSGHLLQALGKRHWPSLDAPFNHPTAAAQAPDGEIYVADGYGNSSVHRFAADGTLLATWGGPGAGPGPLRHRTPSGSIASARCWSATARTTASRCSTATAPSSPNGATSIIRCRSGWTTATWCS